MDDWEKSKEQLSAELQSLRNSESRFRRLAGSGLMGIIVATLDGRIAEANDTFLHMVGYTRAELEAGQVRWDTMTPPAYRYLDEQAIHQLQATGSCPPWEKEYIRKDGQLLPVVLGVAWMDEAKGETVCFVLDRSASKKAEDALHQSEERYRAFIAQSTEGIWRYELNKPIPIDLPTDEQVVRMYDSHLAECNDAMARMYGYDHAAELIGTPLEELLDPANEQNIAMLRAFIEGEYRLVDIETQEQDREGRSLYFLNNLVGFVEQGALVRAWGVQRDITELKRGEQERAELLAREQEARTRAEQAHQRLTFLVEASSLLPASLDHATTLASLVQLVVPTLADSCAILVMSEDEQLVPVEVAHVDPTRGELLWELLRRYPPNLEAETPITSVLRTGRATYVPDVSPEFLRTITHDEAQRHLIAHVGVRAYIVAPLSAREQLLGLLIVGMSESGRLYGPEELALVEELGRRAALAWDNARLYQEAQRAIQLREQFLAIASHELKTPLTTIKGYADLLLRRAARPDAGEEPNLRVFHILHQETQRMGQLIDLLLDLSRLQSGGLHMRREAVDLSALLHRLVETIQPTLTQHTLDLVGGDEVLLVQGDPLRLEQIVRNLLTNAIKYSPYGGLVSIRATQEGEEVHIAIQDQGMGIPPDALPHIFEQFYRVGEATSQGIGGVGLGLYIVRHLVEAHGGSIHASSESGVGSTFTVILPRLR